MSIENLIESAWDRKQSQKNLEEKANSLLCIAHLGGMWRCDREFISFLHAMKDHKEIVIADIYNVPRKVDPEVLLDLAKSRYQYVMNNWMIEWNDLAKARKPETLIRENKLKA